MKTHAIELTMMGFRGGKKPTTGFEVKESGFATSDLCDLEPVILPF